MRTSIANVALRSIGRQDWLRGRDRILRVLSHPDKQTTHPFETDFFGVPYVGNLNNFIDWTVYFYGAFAAHELFLLEALASLLRPLRGPVNFFDIGANIGHHTLFMSRHADGVFAFEPYAQVREEMLRKLDRASAKNVDVFPVALGDRNESASYHPPTGANQGTGTLGDDLPSNVASHVLEVEVVRGDDFFASRHLPNVSLLKMDVEGFEIKAIAGMKDTLWRDRPPILMEIRHEDVADSGYERMLRELLYPDHVMFEVRDSKRRFSLKPYSSDAHADEALILPSELAGIVPQLIAFQKEHHP